MESDKQKLLQFLTGYWISQAIQVAAKLGIADLVKEGRSRPRTWRRRPDARAVAVSAAAGAGERRYLRERTMRPLRADRHGPLPLGRANVAACRRAS